MKPIIIVTHGPTAKAILSTVEMICGKQNKIKAVCFKENESLDSLKAEILKDVNSLGSQNGVDFLVDIQGGTPFNVIIQILNSLKDSCLITGVNVPMILQAVLVGKQNNIEDKIISSAKTSIKKFTHLDSKTENEEF